MIFPFLVAMVRVLTICAKVAITEETPENVKIPDVKKAKIRPMLIAFFVFSDWQYANKNPSSKVICK